MEFSGGKKIPYTFLNFIWEKLEKKMISLSSGSKFDTKQTPFTLPTPVFVVPLGAEIGTDSSRGSKIRPGPCQYFL